MKFAAALVLALAAPAAAETLSTEIAAKGLAATETRLAALAAPSPDETFALAAVSFLSGIEHALQTQWRYGMDQAMGSAGDELGLPFLRLPVPPNPSAEAFSGATVTTLFTGVRSDMEAAIALLSGLPAGTEVSLELAFSDLWFDVNANAARDPGEDAYTLIGPQLLGWSYTEPAPGQTLPTIHFDTADGAWLSAYAHLLAGTAETILAYDPAVAIDRALAARIALKVAPPGSGGEWNFDASFGQFMDAFAMLEGAVNQPPKSESAHAAKAHFLAMIEDNRRFWAAVATETDNDREWIPNDAQTSALGLVLPPGTGNVWLGVLADAEALLTGRLLLPYWRGPEGQGINLGRMFDDPAPMSITGWVQGWAAVPYLEQGPVISSANLNQFEALMGGDAGLMMVFLN